MVKDRIYKTINPWFSYTLKNRLDLLNLVQEKVVPVNKSAYIFRHIRLPEIHKFTSFMSLSRDVYIFPLSEKCCDTSLSPVIKLTLLTPSSDHFVQ